MMSTQPLAAQDEYLLDKILLEITALRWKQALALFSEMSAQDAAARQLKRLALNMTMAQKHRAILYNQLTLCIEQGKLNLHYKPAAGGQGEWETVAHETAAGIELDHPMQSPLAQAKRRIGEMEPVFARDDAVAIIGIEDGYMLSALARRKQTFSDGRATAIFTIEPEAERVLACFQIHDWSGESGPLTHPAFEWIVGKDWSFELKNRLQQDPMLPAPVHALTRIKAEESALQTVSREVIARRKAHAAEQFTQFKSRKELCSKRAVAKLLVDNPKRMTNPPKVAVIGSRFSRMSTQLAPEIARSLAGLGWRVAAVIENNERQRLSPQVIQDRLEGFDPNLIVCVHQPLTDLPDTLEPNTPILHFGAVPDDVTGQEASVRVTLAEPLSPAHLKVGDRAIVSPGIMAQITLPTARRTKAPRLVLLGDAPAAPIKLLRQAIETCQGSASTHLTERVGHALMEHYDKGRCLSTLGQMEALIERCAGSNCSDSARREGLDKLWPVNEALYTLHTAHWAAKACKAVDGELKLCGARWDTHAHLAAFHQDMAKAKGSRAGIIQGATACLHTHPGFCLNADLLTLVAEGAFVLIRDHPLNQALPDLAAFMVKHTPNAKNMREATAIVGALKDEQLAATLQTLAQAMSKTLPKDAPDPLTLIRSCARSGVLDNQMQPIPQLPEISFGNVEQLSARLKHWHDRPEECENLVRAQQETLHGRLAMDPTILRAVYLLARRFVVNA